MYLFLLTEWLIYAKTELQQKRQRLPKSILRQYEQYLNSESPIFEEESDEEEVIEQETEVPILEEKSDREKVIEKETEKTENLKTVEVEETRSDPQTNLFINKSSSNEISLAQQTRSQVKNSFIERYSDEFTFILFLFLVASLSGIVLATTGLVTVIAAVLLGLGPFLQPQA